MAGLYIVTAVLTAVSMFLDRDKTFRGIKTGIKKFRKILPSYLGLLILIAVILFYSEKYFTSFLGQKNALMGLLTGLTIGSVTMMPGFIAYPLAGVLVSKGVLYTAAASFVTSLMMVGVLTYTVEKEYMGVKATLMRNLTSLAVAAVISAAIGFYYGEI